MKTPEEHMNDIDCRNFDLTYKRHIYQELNDGSVRIVVENCYGVVVSISKRMMPNEALNYLIFIIGGRSIEEDTDVLELIA